MKLQKKCTFGWFRHLPTQFYLILSPSIRVLCNEEVEDSYEDETELTENRPPRQKLTHETQVSIHEVLASTHTTPMKIMPSLCIFNLQYYQVLPVSLNIQKRAYNFFVAWKTYCDDENSNIIFFLIQKKPKSLFMKFILTMEKVNPNRIPLKLGNFSRACHLRGNFLRSFQFCSGNRKRISARGKIQSSMKLGNKERAH